MNIDRKIVRVGNSQGIVLPKNILRLADMDVIYLNLKVERGKLILTAKNKKAEK